MDLKWDWKATEAVFKTCSAYSRMYFNIKLHICSLHIFFVKTHYKSSGILTVPSLAKFVNLFFWFPVFLIELEGRSSCFRLPKASERCAVNGIHVSSGKY